MNIHLDVRPEFYQEIALTKSKTFIIPHLFFKRKTTGFKRPNFLQKRKEFDQYLMEQLSRYKRQIMTF